MNNNKVKVMIITYLPWRNDINVGNTITNLFEGLNNQIEFSNIFFKDGRPDNELCDNYFIISEKELAKSIITRKKVGKKYKIIDNNSIEKKSKAYSKARQLRWDSLLLMQDLIGVLGNWKSDALDNYITNNNPDLIFAPIGRTPITNKVLCYLSKKYNIPVFGYIWDDHYSMKKFSLSPFFWFRTLLERKNVGRALKNSYKVYSISKEMCEEYGKIFKKEFNLLYKGHDFSDNNYVEKDEINNPLEIVYMGNIGNNRWKSLGEIATAVKIINGDTIKAKLSIYTMSPKSKKIVKKLNLDDNIGIKPPVPNEEVKNVMRNADILLHIEPASFKDKCFFRLSFSTKLVDYFYAGRCIMAFGPENSSLKYLKRNDAGIVVNSYDEIIEELTKVINDKNRIIEYGIKAWQCGARNHQIKTIQQNLIKDFETVIKR